MPTRKEPDVNSPSPSLFEQVVQQHAASFAGTYKGGINAAAILVSSRPVTERAKAALTAAFRELGYSSSALGWAVPNGQPAGANCEAGASGNLAGGVALTTEPDDERHGSAVPNASSAAPDSAQHADAASAPGSGNLFTLIEAICPLAVVALDHKAVEALSRSFNVALPLEVETLLLGHACVCFEDFTAMLEGPETKQKAWRLLKVLPKL